MAREGSKAGGGARIDKGQREDMGKREKEGMGGAGKTELCRGKGQGNIGFTSAWERWNRKGMKVPEREVKKCTCVQYKHGGGGRARRIWRRRRQGRTKRHRKIIICLRL